LGLSARARPENAAETALKITPARIHVDRLGLKDWRMIDNSVASHGRTLSGILTRNSHPVVHRDKGQNQARLKKGSKKFPGGRKSLQNWDR
jgi:hypothetical protein